MKITDYIPMDEFIGQTSLDNDIQSISRDTRTLKKDDLFFLIDGEHFKPENIIPVIISKRPVAVISEYCIDMGDIPVFLVKNVRRAYSFATFHEYGLSSEDFEIVGVTGTNGKTTTATYLYKIMSKYEKIGFIGTGKILIGETQITPYDYSMTTPDPELLYSSLKKMKQEGIKRVVMEVSSHSLSLEKVAPLHFKIAIFTNLSEEHLDFHKTMENYFQSKFKLFTKCDLGIVNSDDKYGLQIAKKTPCKIICAGAFGDVEVMAKNIENFTTYSKFLYWTDKFCFIVKCNLAGLYNVTNVTLAITAAIALGIKPCLVKETVNEITSIEGRLEKVCDYPTIYLDYAHTEYALENVLKTISSVNNKGKIITVFGCGGNRDKGKRPKMANVAEKYSDYTIVTSDNSREENTSSIIKDIISGFKKSDKHTIISNRKTAIESAIEMATEKDTILIAGKGHEKYILDKTGYHSFDEKSIIKNALITKERAKNESNT